MTTLFSCSADLLSKLDNATTAIFLNIAEGNGRFTGADQAKFVGIAYKATVHSASLVDLAFANGADVPRVDEGRELFKRIAPCSYRSQKSIRSTILIQHFVAVLRPNLCRYT
jgi:four helix bundle protein